MDFKNLMESILLIDTINKYLNSSDEQFYYEKILNMYKKLLVEYIDYYNPDLSLSDLEDLSKVLGESNSSIIDGLNELSLFVNSYDSSEKMLSEIFNLISRLTSKDDFNYDRLKSLLDSLLNSYDYLGDTLYISCKILKELGFFKINETKNKKIVKKNND